MEAKFKRGVIVETGGIIEFRNKNHFNNEFVFKSLNKHLEGDWGDIGELDRESNQQALQTQGRLVSVCHNGKDKIFVITEADRSATTILLPEEY